jgi:hypothetical protein
MLCGVHGVLITLSCSMIDMHIGDSLLLDCYAMTRCLCGILPQYIEYLCGLVDFFMEHAHRCWLFAWEDDFPWRIFGLLGRGN